MTAFLHQLLTVGLTAGWIAAAVLLVRLLLKKAPRWITVLLWALVALRLLLPFTLESPVGVVPVTRVEQMVETVLPPSVPPVTEEPSTDAEPVPPSGADTVEEATPPLSQPSQPTESATVPWDAILFGVWAVGVTGMLLYLVISTVRLRLRMRDAVKLQGRVYQSDKTSSPFVLGVLRPRIYLPYGLDTEEQQFVIIHEESHIKRGDHLWKPLGFFLLSVYWFQPLLWVAYWCLCRDIEAACDERVIRTLTAEDRKRYSYTLLTIGQERRRIAACPVAFGEIGIKERVKRVKVYKKPAVWIVAVALLLAAIAAVCLLTNPMSSGTPSVQGTFEGATLSIHSDPRQKVPVNEMDVAEAKYKMLEDGTDKPLRLRIDKVDTEEMTITVGFSKPLWVDGAKADSVTIPYNVSEITVCSDEGVGEDRYVYTLQLDMPKSSLYRLGHDMIFDADWDDKRACRTVYDGQELQLTLHDDLEVFQMTFGRLSSHEMRGKFRETEDQLILTEDAGVTEYVFRKEADGRLRYDADASYRHKYSFSLALDDGTVLNHSYRFTVEEINDYHSSDCQRVTVCDFDGRVVLQDEQFSGGAKEERLSTNILRIEGYHMTDSGTNNRHLYVDLNAMTALDTFDQVISSNDVRASASLIEEGGMHFVRVVQYEADSDFCGTQFSTPVDTKFRLYSVEDIATANVRVWLEEYRLTIAYTNKVGKPVVTVYNWRTGERVESRVHTVGGSVTSNENASIETVFTEGERRLHYSGISRAFYHLGNGQYVDLLTALQDGTLTLETLVEELRTDLENGALRKTGMDRSGIRDGTYDENDASQGVTLRRLSDGDRHLYIGDTTAAVLHDTTEPLAFAAVCY